LQILLDDPENELSLFLKGLKYDSGVKIIKDVVCGTLCELIKRSLEKDKPIIEISIRLRLGENIFSAISSLQIKGLVKH
jgi:hypothetical protein